MYYYLHSDPRLDNENLHFFVKITWLTVTADMPITAVDGLVFLLHNPEVVVGIFVLRPTI